MTTEIVNWIITTSHQFFTDLGVISNKVSGKLEGNSLESAKKSLLSSHLPLTIF
jgi:hypothetical protein